VIIPIKTDEEIKTMRIGGKILASVLAILEPHVKKGTPTQELAKIAANEVKKQGGEAAFLDYSGFPASICVSINDNVVHGLPSEKTIKNGDIVSLDFGVKYQGYYTDAARTYLIGSDPDKQKFINITKQSLDRAIDKAREGARIGDISFTVQHILESNKYGVVRDLIGHGVGRQLHEDPNIPNFGHAETGPVLKAGMTLAIEPMSTIGDFKVFTAEDGWSIMTKDGSLSAHFEDTVLVTKEGPEILTRF
jgi:methionyl aminopeptidase